MSSEDKMEEIIRKLENLKAKSGDGIKSNERIKLDEKLKLLKEMQEKRDDGTRMFLVNKRTHRIRFECETEDSVVIVIEKREE